MPTIVKGTFDEERTADGVSASPQPARPIAVADDRILRVLLLIVHREAAATFHRHAQTREEVPGDHVGHGRFCLGAVSHRDLIEAERHVSQEIREHASLGTQLLEDWV